MATTTLEMITGALAGRYTLEREVGSGGMAVVYLAHDVKHDRQVALKVLRPELAAVIGAERFLAEIRTTASLQHPGILPLYDSGEAGAQLFYVMPYVDGESLRELLERETQLPVGDALRIARELGESLAYAHDHGVIHRDVKPENVLLQGRRPIIADFGIALAVQEAAGNRITQTGMSLGTPQYMSPEQAAGERNVDGRTDQYALGVILYEMLAGETPFSAPNAQAMIAKMMTEEPRPLLSLRKNVPTNVANAVHRALEKLPADRFETTHDFVRAISGDGSRVSAYTMRVGVGMSARQTTAIAATALAVGALIGGGITRAVSRSAGAPAAGVVRFTIDPDSGRRIGLACCGNFFTIAPDGRRIAYQGADGDSVFRIHIRGIDSVGSRSLLGTENARELFFSPDGAQIGFAVGRLIRAVDLRSGAVHTVASLPPTGFMGGGAWTSDDHIVYSVANRLYRVPASGGALEDFFHVDTASGELQVGGPHYVPGANALLFSVQRASGEPLVRELWLGSNKARSIGVGVSPSYVSAGGFLVAARGNGTLEAWRFDPATGDTLGAGRTIARDIALRSPVFLFAEYAAAANGTIVDVLRDRDPSASIGVLHIVSSSGVDEAYPLPFVGIRLVTPRFSPDGSRILMVSSDLRRRIASVVVYDPQRRSATTLPASRGVYAAAWTRAGDSIVSVTTTPEIVIQSVAGAGNQRRIAELPGWGEVTDVDVALSGIVFSGEHDGSFDVGLADGAGHARALLATPAEELSPRVSPDGRHVAFTVTAAGKSSIQVASFPSLDDRILVAEGAVGDPRWLRDGGLAFADSARHVVAVTFKNGTQLEVASRRILGSIPPEAHGWDVDPAGKRLTYAADRGGLQARSLAVTMNALSGR